MGLFAPLDGALGRGKRLHLGNRLPHGDMIDLAHIDRLADILKHGEEQLAADVLTELFQAVEKRSVGEQGMSDRKAEIDKAAEDTTGIGVG